MQKSHYRKNRIPVRMPSRAVDPGRSRHQVNADRGLRGGRNARQMLHSREDRPGYSARGVPENRYRLDSVPILTPSSTADNETYGLNIDFLRQLGISLPLSNRVFMSNIPKDLSIGHIYEIFVLAGRITWIDVFLDQDGRTMGRGLCEYSHPIEAVQAVSMLSGQLLFNNTLLVKMDIRSRSPITREGELPAGLSGLGLGLGLNGAPLNLMNPTAKKSQF